MLDALRDSLFGLATDEFRGILAGSGLGLVVVLAEPEPRLHANAAGWRILGLDGAGDQDALPLARLPARVRVIEGDAEYTLGDWLSRQLAGAATTRDADIRVAHGQAPARDLLASINCLRAHGDHRRGCAIWLTDVSQARRLGQLPAQRDGEGMREFDYVRADQRLNRAARLSSLGTMASGVAHELKNPVNAIHMNAELASVYVEAGGDAEEVLECLERIKEDCRRAADIADGILNFARGNGQPREELALAELFDGLSRLAANVPGMREGILELANDAPDERLVLSRTEFEQAMLNLIQNSLEAGASKVRVCADRLGDRVRMEISDDGPGIAEKLASHIFDPFFTTRGRAGGSGLGLSLVHRIITEHDGDIDVESEPGKGCRFIILLPAGVPTGEDGC